MASCCVLFGRRRLAAAAAVDSDVLAMAPRFLTGITTRSAAIVLTAIPVSIFFSYFVAILTGLERSACVPAFRLLVKS